MTEMTNRELRKVNGGGAWLALGIVAGIIFLIGVIDGYVRPLSCNN